MGILNFLDYRKILGEAFETLWVLRLQQVVCLVFFRNKTLQVYQKLGFSKNQPTVESPQKSSLLNFFLESNRGTTNPRMTKKEYPLDFPSNHFVGSGHVCPSPSPSMTTPALNSPSFLPSETGWFGKWWREFFQPTWLSTSPGGVFYSYPPGGFSNLVKVDFCVFFFSFFLPERNSKFATENRPKLPKKETHISTIDFQGAFAVSFRECMTATVFGKPSSIFFGSMKCRLGKLLWLNLLP